MVCSCVEFLVSVVGSESGFLRTIDFRCLKRADCLGTGVGRYALIQIGLLKKEGGTVCLALPALYIPSPPAPVRPMGVGVGAVTAVAGPVSHRVPYKRLHSCVSRPNQISKAVLIPTSVSDKGKGEACQSVAKGVCQP